MNTYVFKNNNGTMVERSDGAFIPWDSVNNRPVGYQVDVGRIWVTDGSPTPAPYVAPSPTAAQTYASALNGGVTVTWTTSTSLNGTYAVDQDMQNHIVAERVSTDVNNTFANKRTTRSWPLMTSPLAFVTMTTAQFNAFATAIAQYVDALADAYTTAAAGGQATWPSSSITVSA